MERLPDWIGDITGLHTLNISELQITAIPQSILKRNIPFLTDRDVWKQSDYKGIYIENTELPPQLINLFNQSQDKSPKFQESHKLIEAYFETPRAPIREANVIFLGDRGAGKTYTIQRMCSNCRKGDYPTKELHGIRIEDLYMEKDGETYTIRVWDLGGEDIVPELHRCFLTEQACDIIMVDTWIDRQR